MICIIKRERTTQEIVSWIIAMDYADARRHAQVAGEHALAEFLTTGKGIWKPDHPYHINRNCPFPDQIGTRC